MQSRFVSIDGIRTHYFEAGEQHKGARPSIVLLHSAEAARHFAAEMDRLGIPRARIHLAALGPRIAAAGGPGWAQLSTAPRPTDVALLALCRQLCQ